MVTDPTYSVYNAKRITIAVVIAVAVYTVLDVLAAILLGVTPPPTPGTLSNELALTALVELVKILALIVSGVFYFIWLARSIKSAAELSSRQFPLQPAAAIVYHFIPILGLFKPFQTMQMLFSWSTPKTETVPAKTKGLIWAWWVPWMVGNLVAYASLQTTDVGAELASSLFTVVAAFALIALVRDLPERQSRRLQEWNLEQVVPSADGFVAYPRSPDPSMSM